MSRSSSDTEPFDVVEEAALESFPASDAPAWAAGRRPAEHPAEAKPGVVAGIFDSEEAAAHAFAGLVEAHFEPLTEISILAAHRGEHEEVAITGRFVFDRGARIVSGVGATLGAAGAAPVSLGVAAPPFGLLAAGPILAALQGACAGGVVEAATGALAELGVRPDEAEFHATRIHDGAFWVGVHARGQRAEKALDILARTGARHFKRRSS